MEQGDPEALTAPWALQGFPQGPGRLRGGSDSAGEEGERFVPNVDLAGAHIPSSPAGHLGGSAGLCGETGTSRLPVSRGGIIPWPFQHRRGEVQIQRASKATSPPPQRPQGQGSRRVQGRGEAAALGLARGEAAVLPLPPALRAPDFPSRHGLSPLRVCPRTTRCCSPCWCFPQNH